MATIAEFASGFPGYNATIPPENGFISEVLVRNGYYMPAKKSSAITMAWMFEIFQDRAWCPKQSDIRALR